MHCATHRTVLAGLGTVTLALQLVSGIPAPATAAEKPLGEQEIIELLNAHVASAHLSTIVDERGIDFVLTDEIEQRVRDAGGGDDVISALRRASHRREQTEAPRKAELVIKTIPGEAQVYLNDEPKGMTSPEGDLRLPDLQPTTYALRVSLPGYQSFEKSVAVQAGEPQTVLVTLVEKTAVSQPDSPTIPSPQIPGGTGEGGLPMPGAKVLGIQFYEGPFTATPPRNTRVYRTSFYRLITRTIYWELDLKFPNPQQRIDFQIDAIWYRPDGSQMSQQATHAYVLPSWGVSYHSNGYGFTDPNHWAFGTYRVELYYKGTRLTSGSFQIN